MDMVKLRPWREDRDIPTVGESMIPDDFGEKIYIQVGNNVDVSTHAEKWTLSLDESTVFGCFYWTTLHARFKKI